MSTAPEFVKTRTFNSDNKTSRQQLYATAVTQVGVLWILVVFLFAAAGLYFRHSIAPPQRATFALVFLVGAPTYLAWVFGSGAYRRITRIRKLQRSIPGATMVVVTFRPEALEYESEAGASVRIPNTLVPAYKPRPDGILVSLGLGHMFVPKEAFDSEGDFQTAVRWVLDAQMAKAAKPSSPLLRQ
ncbi:MAG: hypothetical protein JSS66_12065 [Armatimonadetes bacterium]|nr:hypothetical protein [Armatimonadota bacterium]